MNLLKFWLASKRAELECWMLMHVPDRLQILNDKYGYKTTRCKRCKKRIMSYDGSWWVDSA